ncbi:DUF4123 domain-containing protein [Paludisphaera soli]|uniref:DUF4123 domain-containing protein n=1 Tax=Paludisphaera soli TaxID=2712865 RepID=UPI0013E9FF96|nr:DUF4123 domain-containing protein [Paludisphaera soli]
MSRVLVLEVRSGPNAGRSFALEAGAEAVVGRAEPSAMVLVGDRTMSRRHFSVEFDGREGRVRDLGSSHGTTVNGSEVEAGLVGPGDLIGAGETLFRVRLEAGAPSGAVLVAATPAEPLGPSLGSAETTLPHASGSPQDRAIAILRGLRDPLYSILDAARGPDVYRRVLECPERHQSMFDEPRASELAVVAPYLIELPRHSTFLDALVRDGWGKAWGVFLTSVRPFDELRAGLFRLATRRTASGGEGVFRFYDPRVLRTHLPAGKPAEVAYFRDVGSYLCEREDGGLDRYRADRNGVAIETIPLDDGG